MKKTTYILLQCTITYIYVPPLWKSYVHPCLWRVEYFRQNIRWNEKSNPYLTKKKSDFHILMNRTFFTNMPDNQINHRQNVRSHHLGPPGRHLHEHTPTWKMDLKLGKRKAAILRAGQMDESKLWNSSLQYCRKHEKFDKEEKFCKDEMQLRWSQGQLSGNYFQMQNLDFSKTYLFNFFKKFIFFSKIHKFSCKKNNFSKCKILSIC